MDDGIGVVIPTYNCRGYLSECIESVLNQSYSPCQIVVCDDCSTDGTQEVIMEYQERYPDVIESVLHSENIGIPRNFNSGLRLLNTEYISIISGDDLWHKDKIKLELEALKNKTGCLWAYSNSAIIDKESNYVSKFKRKYDGAAGDISFEVLTHQMTLRNWLIHKDLLEKVGVFDEDFTIFEDWDFKIRLAKESTITHVDSDSVFYRKHDKGISSSSGDVYVENLVKIFCKHKDLISALPRDKKSIVKKSQFIDMRQNVNRYLKNCSKKYSRKYYKYQVMRLGLLLAEKIS